MHWGSQRSFPASDCDSKTTTALGSQTSQTPALSASPHRQLSNIFLSSSFFLWTHSASFLQCGAFLTIWKHAVPASSSIHQIFGASAFFGFLIVQPKRKQREREIPVEQPPLTQESRSCPLPALLGGPGPDQGKDGTGTRRDKTTMLRTTYLNSMRQTRSLCVSHHDGN